MSATKALQLWCKQQCEGYKDVSITNMTTSFRDGLAFCAILHRHRPDLINFSALHKENVYENNQLAFKVAERELGIPALLDAEDMVALKVPDRLSILTYVSQYYNYFHGRSPIGGMAGVKRSPSVSSEEPAGKKVVPEPVSPSPPKPSPVHVPSEPKTNPALKGKENAPVEAKRRVLAENATLRSSSCAICGDHVHLVQRLLMDGKLYHRSCFRCKQCSNTLKSGNYKVGSDPGTFICNQHEQPTHVQNPLHVDARKILGENKPARPPPTPWSKEVESKKPGQESRKPSQAPQSNDAVRKALVQERSNVETQKSVSVAENPASRWSDMNKGNKSGRCENSIASPFSSNWTPSSAKTQQAREKFFQASSLTVDKTEPIKSHGTPLNPSPLTVDKTEPIKSHGTPLNPSQVTGRLSFPGPGSNASSSEKDRARNILLHALQPSTNKPASLSITVGKPTPVPSGLQHPEMKNLPTSEISRPAGVSSATEKPRRDPLRTPHVVESLVQDPGNRPGIRTATQIRVKVANGQSANAGHKVDIKVTEGVIATEEKPESPADWRSRLKPVANKFSSQGEARFAPKPAEIHKTVINVALKPTQDDRKPVTSPAVQDIVPSPDPNPKKKLLVPHVDVSSGWQKAKQQWEDPSANQALEVPSLPQRAVAPVRPSSPRTFQKHPSKPMVSPSKLHPDYIPEEKIQQEVRQIEKDLDRLELQGVDLEKQLRGCEGDDTEDALMVEWFKLIHEKQLLLRRESELMHKMNQQKLEEKQWDIETELRSLMSKSDSLKTPREKTREEELLKLYLETVNDRNKIVEDLDEDRLRELEEDEVLAAMIQKLDGPRSTPDSEKKKTKFGFFKILKAKN